MASIAYQQGFANARRILDHPSNDGLRRQGRRVDVLFPGDRIVVPALEGKWFGCATGQRHRFVRKGGWVPLAVRVVYHDGTPIANKAYTMSVCGRNLTGSTGPDGEISQLVPVGAQAAKVEVEIAPPHGMVMEVDLAIGHLDPIDETSGVQGRLINLGYDCAASGEMDESTATALRLFQDKNGLPISGQADDATRRKLVEIHGGV